MEIKPIDTWNHATSQLTLVKAPYLPFIQTYLRKRFRRYGDERSANASQNATRYRGNPRALQDEGVDDIRALAVPDHRRRYRRRSVPTVRSLVSKWINRQDSVCDGACNQRQSHRYCYSDRICAADEQSRCIKRVVRYNPQGFG
jgi:hypothetical protein